MNRIVLIGNGFDLAHNMKTSYKAFINDYWNSIITHLQQRPNHGEYRHDDFVITGLPRYWDEEKTYQSLKKSLNLGKQKIVFENKFLEVISEKSSLNNWVDIECEYYELLKEIINNPSFRRYESANKLNNDFEKIKKYLEKYLTRIELAFNEKFRDPILKNKIGSKIYSSFKLKDFTDKTINEITKLELNKLEKRKKNIVAGIEQPVLGNNLIMSSNSTNPEKELKEILLNENAHNDFDLLPDQIIFLNFNYTSTALLYDDKQKYLQFPKGFKKDIITEFINIHGELNNPTNQLIFGFGDEIDNDYKKIEALNNNNYLQNIKSINYLETDNYKKLLRILDDDLFQIFIFGHSCGLSDRTLINTLFEHPNCGSIKPYYYKLNETTDNYSEITRNISRNFNSKSIMREKVVNKSYCKPLVE